MRLAILVGAVLALLTQACGGGEDRPLTDALTPLPSPSASASASPGVTPVPGAGQLIVANSIGSNISLIDLDTGQVEARLQVGAAPHHIELAGKLGYVTTATGLAMFDLSTGTLFAAVPFRTDVGPPGKGEFREGGMGLAVAPDGERVYVGVYTRTGSYLEEFHIRDGFLRSIPIGDRPFDVVIDPNGSTVYSIDHDSYTITGVDIASWTTRTIEAAPLGNGAYDKPHYAAIAGRELILPYQGNILLALNLDSGARRELPLTANTHQHGIAVTPDGAIAVIVGAGPAGDAMGAPSLTLLNLVDGSERIIPLSKPHELVALSPDGRTAYLSGGYLLEGGWDGITVVDLDSGSTREIYVPDRPLGIAVVPALE